MDCSRRCWPQHVCQQQAIIVCIELFISLVKSKILVGWLIDLCNKTLSLSLYCDYGLSFAFLMFLSLDQVKVRSVGCELCFLTVCCRHSLPSVCPLPNRAGHTTSFTVKTNERRLPGNNWLLSSSDWVTSLTSQCLLLHSPSQGQGTSLHGAFSLELSISMWYHHVNDFDFHLYNVFN